MFVLIAAASFFLTNAISFWFFVKYCPAKVSHLEPYLQKSELKDRSELWLKLVDAVTKPQCMLHVVCIILSITKLSGSKSKTIIAVENIS